MASTSPPSTAVEPKKDWSEFLFGFAVSLLRLWKHGSSDLTKPTVLLKSTVRSLVIRRAQDESEERLLNVCVCSCHCSIKSSAENGSEKRNHHVGRSASDATRPNQISDSDAVQRSKFRHNSADHAAGCYRTVLKRCGSAHDVNMGTKLRSNDVKSGCVCCLSEPQPSEVTQASTVPLRSADSRAKKVDKVRRRQVDSAPLLSDELAAMDGFRHSSSDPVLNSYTHDSQNCDNENMDNFAARNKVVLLESENRPLSSVSMSSPMSKLKSNYSFRKLARKRTSSFRLSSKNLAKKFSSNKMPEKVCPSPVNVKLSAINNLNINKPLEALRDQMDGLSRTNLTSRFAQEAETSPQVINSHFSCGKEPDSNSVVKLNEKNWGDCKLNRKDLDTSKLNEKNWTASLRRRKKTLVARSLTLSSRVRPTSSGCPGDVISDDGGTSFSAWSDEYDQTFDYLHHRNCPCRATLHQQQLKDEMADVTAEMETLEGGEDGKNNPKSKQMSIGRKKFNMDPKKGIEYLIEHGLLKNTPDDISKFLYNGEGLNKTAIGDYLGERHEFNQTVLDAFVALHNFTDLILVQALRQFLWSFRLPGEAQKIDRMMERFAGHYCDLNPTIFKHPDTCFVLSFAIIMLNTSLHNPAVKDKQTLEQFINMNRGIDNGDDLPRELLESLYESIKTEPFKIPEDDGNDLMHTFFNPDREGWLWKQGGRYKSWKRRWFILNDNCLYYFEFTTDKEPRGIIPLENIEVREVHDRNKPHCFELQSTSKDVIKACKTDSEGKVVEGKHMVYRMSAATHEEKEEWIKCIRQSISHNPFYDLLAKRKKNIQKNSS